MEHLHNFSGPARSSFTENNSFSLSTINPLCNNTQIDEPGDLDNQFVIIWVVKGSGDYWADHRPCDVENNCLLFIKPGQFHTVQLDNAVEGYIFSFCKSFLGIEDHDSELLLRSLSQMFTKQYRLLGCDAMIEMQDITRQIVKEYNDHNLYKSEILRRYFKIFLIHLSMQFAAPKPVARPSRNVDLLQNFVSLLEQNFRNQKMVADYADRLAVTPNYLNEVIKKITGYPAGYHIRQRVALEAKRKAANSDVGMKEVAYDLGVFDLAHFSKFFKNTTGISFSDFKKNGIGFSTGSLLVN